MHRVTQPSVIYAIQCIENNKVYIGRTQHLSQRITQHWYAKAKDAERIGSEHDIRLGITRSEFSQDFKRYGGPNAFKVYVLEENVSPEMCEERERFWIKEYDSTNPDFGYNRSGRVRYKRDIALESGLPVNLSKR